MIPEFGGQTHRDLIRLAASAAYADDEATEAAVYQVLRIWGLPTEVPPQQPNVETS